MKRVSMVYWLASGVIAITSIAIFVYAARQPAPLAQYTLFAPPMTEEQKIEIQKDIDAQLLRKEGGRQISSTQIAYENGNAVITFPVSGESNTPNTTCDFGYACFWEHVRYGGLKLALRSTPTSHVENLEQYNMSNKISSWKHNNNIFYVALAGASQINLGGTMVLANTWDRDIGGECCPFSVEYSTQHAPPPEFIFKESLSHDNRAVSIGFFSYPAIAKPR